MSKIDLDKFPTSETAQRMIHRVSPIYANAYTVKWLYQVMGLELDDVWKIVNEMTAQAFTQTVTWGIEAQEYKYSITPDDTLTLEERRARLYRHKTLKFPISPGRIEKYINDAWNITADIDETRAPGIFFIRISQDKENHLRKMLSDLYDIKPSHLDMKAIWATGVKFFLNRSGGVLLRVTPGATWETQEPYIVFSTGLNAAGPTETVEHTETTTMQRRAYIFSGATLNGRLQLNGGGKYAVDQYDAGRDITESWLVFKIPERPTLNGRARLNATPTETRSRVVHVVEWRDRVTQRPNTLNRAGGSWRSWTESTTKTKRERRYKSPAPYYATNRCGTKTVTWEDIGQDKELSEVVFSGPRLNSAAIHTETAASTTTAETTYILFAGYRINSRNGRPILNRSAPEQHTQTTTTTANITRGLFRGALLNGRLKANGGKGQTITRMVHVPIWRSVTHYTGAGTLNSARHETRTRTIKHTTPARTEKYFSPNRGTLLNGRAVLGDLVL